LSIDVGNLFSLLSGTTDSLAVARVGILTPEREEEGGGGRERTPIAASPLAAAADEAGGGGAPGSPSRESDTRGR
jgi:hypothetical protein